MEYDYENPLDRDKIDVPAWMDDRDWTAGKINDLCYGGCASGCYMPAVVYHDAQETMHKHGDAVLQYLDDNGCEDLTPPKGESWAGIAVFYLSAAVETWANGVLAQIDDGADVYPGEDE